MDQVQLTSHARKQFKKLPKDIQKRIVAKLEFFQTQENPLDFAEVLTDSRLGSYRFRVGSYRVTFDLEENVLVIHEIGHRKDIYR